MPETGPRTGADNLARLAERSLERLGDHPSLYFEGAWHGSAGLATRAARVGAGLVRLGVTPGDRVVVVMANCPEVGITYTGIWRAGAVATPVIFLVSADELRHVLTDSGAVAVVTTPEFLPKVRAAANGLPVRLVVVGATDVDTDTVPFAELEEAEPGSVVDRADDDLAALLYTGGTTGRSKGVMITHSNLCRGTAAIRQISHVPGVDRSLLPLPLSHSYGLMVTVAGLHATEPGTSVLMRWFDPAGWVDLVEQHRVQTCAVVPSMLAMLLTQPLEEHDLSSLRHVGCGASPLPAAVALEFERRVPSATVLEGYGCTESSAVLSAMPPDARRLGTVGIPVPGVRVRVCADDGVDLPVGQDGEILVSGPNITPGYWHDDEQTATALTDGWLHTGDIGRLDADGYLTIVDRKKDLIIRGGFNVFPRDVEEVLVSHPAVTGAIVVGRPEPRVGEEVVAFVTVDASGEVTPEDLVDFARARLAATKYPREVRIIDQIPLTSVGKPNRRAMRDLVTAEKDG
ncbi:MAG TPA: AMP-binding protein [Mycobacteriales bacterium]|jgi:Acyl-CoA synthetases (AMP-forming)/AMP-acid ligases II